MKKSTLVYIIVGLVAFLSAIAGALYVLKKRGILFIDDCCDFSFDECMCDDDCQCSSDEAVEEKPRRAKKVIEAEEVQEG